MYHYPTRGNFFEPKVTSFYHLCVEYFSQFSFDLEMYTLQTINHGTEGNHQVTTRVVTWWLLRKVGEMV